MSDYAKHNIYWGAYQAKEGYQALPKATWRVEYFLGEDEEGGDFSATELTDSLCLILEDDEHSFWPVMSFMSRDEALALAQLLIEKATNTIVAPPIDFNYE